MFANLRGVPAKDTATSVQEVIRMFNLEDHADKECRSYSGGNKRKLSTGIAIIGSPPLIFLVSLLIYAPPQSYYHIFTIVTY